MIRAVVHEFATSVFTTTLKTGLNELLVGGLNMLGGGQGGNAEGGAAGAAAGAAPAQRPGGLIGKVIGGITGGAGGTTGVMNVQAGTVNVNGAAAGGGEGSLTEELAGAAAGGKGEGGIFSGIKGGIMDAFGNVKDLFSGLLGGFGGQAGGFSQAGGAGKALLKQGLSLAASFIPGGQFIAPLLGAAPLARGGIIKGPGTSRSDSIPGIAVSKNGGARPIAVSDGEAILNARAVDILGADFIHAVNSKAAKKYAVGGLVDTSRRMTSGTVSAAASPVTGGSGGQPNLTIMNVLDPSVVGDYTNTRDGNNNIMNVLRKNGLV